MDKTTKKLAVPEPVICPNCKRTFFKKFGKAGASNVRVPEHTLQTGDAFCKGSRRYILRVAK